MEEDLKDGYFVLEGFEKGVEAQLICVLDPLGPVSSGGGGTTRSDSTADVFLRKAKITAEVSCAGGVTSL